MVVENDSDHKNKTFHIYTEKLVVEEGLTDWYDLQWEDDKEDLQVFGSQPESFSLFDITGV